MKICSQEIHGCLLSVVVVQMVTWTVVSVLLFHRGVSNLWPRIGTMDFANETLLNKTVSHMDSGVMRGYTSGVVILIVATMMMVVGPIFLIVVVCETMYRKRRFSKLAQEDLPPKYEDVVMEEMAPRYSTLFLNTDGDEHDI